MYDKERKLIMAIELNSAALNVYRNASFADANTVINNDGAGIKASGVYKGALSALSRSSEEKSANNAVRTELLKALGRAFNVKGMMEVDGKVTFSKEFMARLEKILGADFKRGDFGINANGEVASGKPLTMRRIQAIVKKADLVGNGSFSLPVYEEKLASILKDLGYGKLSQEDFAKAAKKDVVTDAFKIASDMVSFLKNEADKTIGLNPEYEFAVDCDEAEEFNGAKFQYFDAHTNEFKQFSDKNDYAVYMQNRIGVVMHFENSAMDYKNPQSIDKLKSYVVGVVTHYVKSIVDNYFAAKDAGKVQDFLKHLRQPGVCLEARCDRLREFEKDHLSEMTVEERMAAAEAQRVADSVGNGGKPATADRLVFNVIQELMGLDENLRESENWNDFAEQAKQRLVGRNATITLPELEGNGYAFNPVKEDGQELVRPLTAEDVDRIGPACLATVIGVI
jgi:hypothetical protein